MNARDRLARAGWTFWVPCVLSALAIIATVWSIIEPQWIEELFEASPDAGSGETEWWFAVGFGILAITSLVVTRWRWRATLRPA
jgi:hypothetical protein